MTSSHTPATGSSSSLTTQAVDLAASCTTRCALDSPVTLSPYVVAEPGYVVAVRALEEKPHYNEIECTDGVFRTIEAGDTIVGALGGRQALKGYSGHVPRSVAPGDTLHVLNLGGILGRCTSALPDLGPALRCQVLGAVMTEQDGRPVHARIQDDALPARTRLSDCTPLVMVSGTAMDTGKTLAACRIVEGLDQAGLTVGAAKLTGASLMRDVRRMRDHGAAAVTTFTDGGVVCSTEADIVPVAKGLLHHLSQEDLNVIVVELGDGFVGDYGVDDLLVDQELQRATAAHVVAATDLAGAWAAQRMFADRYGAAITAVTGPVTDNDVGRRFVETRFGIPAVNALQAPATLQRHVLRALQDAVPAAPSLDVAPRSPASADAGTTRSGAAGPAKPAAVSGDSLPAS
jgi:molybdopterin-guanine dinucleotide biosynthesis protein